MEVGEIRYPINRIMTILIKKGLDSIAAEYMLQL